MKRTLRYSLCFAVLSAMLVILFFLSICMGSAGNHSLGELIRLFSEGDPIICKIRLPRAAEAAILGGALSVSGYLLQSFFANPIAGPFVLGISSGAKLTVAIAMIFSLSRGIAMNSASMIASSFVGSLASMGMILLISRKIRNMSLLVVSGVMIGYICSAITELAVSFADESNIINLHNWSMGTFSAANNRELGVISITVGVSMILTFLLSKPLGAYRMGESYAENMGVNVKRFRIYLILLSSILSACVTAFAGPVSFVGIAVPHLVKSFFGTAKPIVIIPASFLGGAVFCLFSDLTARMLFAPSEISISTVTAIFGAPVVIWIMLRQKSRRKS